MRILFTGGSGKAGRHVAPYLASLGHTVLNFDRVPLGAEGVEDRIGDMTDAGQVWDVMTSWTGWPDMEAGMREPRFDAVVHFAALARILIEGDGETFRTNVMGTFNVIDAALKTGVRKVIFASSETTYGVCFSADPERRPEYVPVDEEHPVVPEDAYATSKVCNEATARSYQRRTGADIYGLRLNNVIEPHEYAESFPAFMDDPALRRRNIFAYIDVRDLGQMVERCLAKDGLGYEVFNVANDDHSVALSTPDLIERFYPGVPIRREMGEWESFYCTDKAKRLLGYAPQHSWRDVLGDDR